LSNAGEIEALKQQLNELVVVRNVRLYEGEVLVISQKLDELILNYYQPIGATTDYNIDAD
jgi:hypothetical protein